MADYVISDAIEKGNLNLAIEETNKALADGLTPQQIIEGYLIKGMEAIGKKFEDGIVFVPHLLMAARAMKGSLEILKPLFKDDNQMNMGTVVIGTVKGDLHDIGKNLVASMMEGCGFKVINLGSDVSSDKFVSAIKENDANILCMSALLTTTMVQMDEVIKALNEAHIRNKVKVMIGGAPVSSEYAKKIGADGYSENANAAVKLARNLMGVA